MTPEERDQLADLNTSAFVAKRLGLKLSTALEIPTDAVMAMSRYINERERLDARLHRAATSLGIHVGLGGTIDVDVLRSALEEDAVEFDATLRRLHGWDRRPS